MHARIKRQNISVKGQNEVFIYSYVFHETLRASAKPCLDEAYVYELLVALKNVLVTLDRPLNLRKVSFCDTSSLPSYSTYCTHSFWQ